MTREEILAKLGSGEIKPGEAAKLLDALEQTVRVVATQFADATEFLKAAQPVKLEGKGLSVTLTPKTFSTGSYGWSSNGKLVVTLPNGKGVRVQGSINLVVIGSKPYDKAA
jgi:hypothetical protein